ncbi:MAG TPA: type II toxin-antitoxin system VapC family toxin [Longimicrobiaceae bacterium]|nr:type II toxin-antitoxin system VapC family toxin [Longimicrobiaceae bacterium]
MPELRIPPLLLDTHIWIWAMDGRGGEMSAAALEAVHAASARGGLLVSAISAWEVAMLQAKGRLRLGMDTAEWVRRALAAPGVRVAELTPQVAVDSAELPGEVHGDPADRILMATARQTGATLVTRDGRILDYARSGYLAVLDATP